MKYLHNHWEAMLAKFQLTREKFLQLSEQNRAQLWVRYYEELR